MNHARKLAAFLVLVVMTGLVLAGVNREAYQTTRGSGPELLLDDVASVTSAAWATPANPRYTRGNPKIGVGLNSNQAGAVIEVSVGLYHYNPATDAYTFLGLSDVKSITLSSDMEASAGVYTHEDLIEFSTQGASVVDVRITSVSLTGSAVADLYLWGFGTEPELTEAPAGS